MGTFTCFVVTVIIVLLQLWSEVLWAQPRWDALEIFFIIIILWEDCMSNGRWQPVPVEGTLVWKKCPWTKAKQSKARLKAHQALRWLPPLQWSLRGVRLHQQQTQPSPAWHGWHLLKRNMPRITKTRRKSIHKNRNTCRQNARSSQWNTRGAPPTTLVIWKLKELAFSDSVKRDYFLITFF